MNKSIWSNNKTQEDLLSLSPDLLRDRLVEFGYDKYMLEEMEDFGLYDLVADDNRLYERDLSLFDSEISPMIQKQSRDGIILLSGDINQATLADDLVTGSKFCNNCSEVMVTEDEKKALGYGVCDDSGCKYSEMYAVPEDTYDLNKFIVNCMPRAVEEYAIEDVDPRELTATIAANINLDMINKFCDFDKLDLACNRIENTHGPFYGEFTEDLDTDDEEELTESSTKDPETLGKELEEIMADYEEFGAKGFYRVKFSKFCEEFPEFSETVLIPWLTEMEIRTPEELEDTDTLEADWASGDLIIKSDWPCLFDGAQTMVRGRGKRNKHQVQWEKIWKKHYKAYDECYNG